MTRRLSSPVFVGRRAELERLLASAEVARGGRASIVVVGGEAGVGKTRLLEELEASLDAATNRLLVGRCIDLDGGGVPYAPFVEVFRTLGTDRAPDELDRLLGPGRTALARLVPALASDGPVVEARHMDPAAAQGAFMEHVLYALGRLAADRPVALLLEDLQWADGSTRDLVRFLAHSLRTERILMVLTYRSDDLGRRHPLRPLLAELERNAAVDRIALEPFAREELASQLAAILGSPPDAAVVERVHSRSDGNAFFVEELVAAGATDADIPLPATVHDMLAARAARLADETQRVMRIASLLGRRVSHGLLARVTGLDEPLLLEALRDALDAQLIVVRDDAEGGSYEFRHALVQECLADELLPSERTALHARIAALLEAEDARRPGVASRIAHHWYHAHDVARALASAVRAAEDGIDVAAFADAHVQYERAIELWPAVMDAETVAGVDHAALLGAAADAAAGAGDLRRAAALADRAIAELRDEAPLRRVDLAHRAAWYRWDQGDAVEAARLIDEALTDAGGAPLAIRARLLSDLAHGHWSARRYAAQRDAAAEATELAIASGDRVEEARARMALGAAVGELGSVADGVDTLVEALDLLEQGPDDLRAMAAAFLTHLLVLSGDDERTLAHARAEIARTRTAGIFRRYGPYLLSNLVDVFMQTGRYAEAEALLANDDWPRDGNRASAWLHETSADVAAVRGDVHTARQGVDAARRLIGESPAAVDGLWLDRTEAEIARAEGRLEAARAHLDAAIASSVDPARDLTLQWVLDGALRNEADLSVAATLRGDPAAVDDARSRGRRIAGLIEAFAANADPRGWEASLEATRAMVAAERSRLEGRSDPDAWDRMAATAAAIGHRPQHAYARVSEAEALLVARLDRGRATASLREAVELARGIGSRSVIDRAEALARRARIELAPSAADDDGVAPRPAVTDTAARFRLTARELEVLAHVAEGRTNREIGEALFITDKTASVHVTHILDKLGVGSRVEAAIAAQRLGLVGPAD